MKPEKEYLSEIIELLSCIAKNKGILIEALPFIISTDGYVFDDEIVRIICSVGGEFIEVLRKQTETIVFDLANSILRTYSPEIDLLIPHLHTLQS